MKACVKKGRKSFSYYTARAVLIFLVFSMVFILVRILTEKIFVDKWNIQNHFTRIILFDLDIQPPNTSTAQQENMPPHIIDRGEKEKGLIAKSIARAEVLRNSIPDKIKNRFPFRMQIVEGFNKMQTMTGWQILPLDRFRLDGGHLTVIVEKLDVTEHVVYVKKFEEFLQSKGVPFLFIQFPHKNAKTDSFVGHKDYANINADTFLRGLDQNNVDYLDLRSVAEEKGYLYKDLFYKTDHHWTQEAAFWATEIIVEYLNEKYKFGFDDSYLNSANYIIENFPGIFLGSHGRFVSLVHCQQEDLSIYHPIFPTKLHLSIPHRKIDAIGGFDILYDYKLLKKPGNFYRSNAYGSYLHGDSPFVKIENLSSASSGKRILVLKDSMANPVNQFLSLVAKHLSIIDLRYYKGSVLEFIDANKPDVVLMMYYPRTFGNTKMFDIQ